MTPALSVRRLDLRSRSCLQLPLQGAVGLNVDCLQTDIGSYSYRYASFYYGCASLLGYERCPSPSEFWNKRHATKC